MASAAPPASTSTSSAAPAARKPRHYIVCVDTSTSSESSVADEAAKKQAAPELAGAFAEACICEDDDDVLTVMTFNYKVHTHLAAVNMSDLDNSVADTLSLVETGGRTALYDTICAAIDRAGDFRRDHPDVATEIVVYTDGVDTCYPLFYSPDSSNGPYMVGGSLGGGETGRPQMVGGSLSGAGGAAKPATRGLDGRGQQGSNAHRSHADVVERVAHPGFADCHFTFLGVGPHAQKELPSLVEGAKESGHVDVFLDPADNADAVHAVFRRVTAAVDVRTNKAARTALWDQWVKKEEMAAGVVCPPPGPSLVGGGLRGGSS